MIGISFLFLLLLITISVRIASEKWIWILDIFYPVFEVLLVVHWYAAYYYSFKTKDCQDDRRIVEMVKVWGIFIVFLSVWRRVTSKKIILIQIMLVIIGSLS